MIEYIKGTLEELTPTQAVVDCNGVGYALNISLNTFSAIQGKSPVKLYAYEVIREDAYTLYGFASKSERDLFLLLISVSGIGGNTARMILSALSPDELSNVIVNENVNMLKQVKGIGLKTAQRVIVDLKDKVKLSGNAVSAQDGNVNNTEIQDEAVAALTMLGFASAASQRVVIKILKDKSDIAVEEVIKLALKQL